jgi:phage-related minor tail protein
MESEVVQTGTYTVEIYQNKYDPSGDDVTLRYRHGADEAACLAAAYQDYTIPFTSLGFVQVRVEPTI